MCKYITYTFEPHIMEQYVLWSKGYVHMKLSSLYGWIYTRR